MSRKAVGCRARSPACPAQARTRSSRAAPRRPDRRSIGLSAKPPIPTRFKARSTTARSSDRRRPSQSDGARPNPYHVAAGEVGDAHLLGGDETHDLRELVRRRRTQQAPAEPYPARQRRLEPATARSSVLFPRAVASQQRDEPSAADSRRNIFEQHPVPVADSDMLQFDVCHTIFLLCTTTHTTIGMPMSAVSVLTGSASCFGTEIADEQHRRTEQHRGRA